MLANNYCKTAEQKLHVMEMRMLQWTLGFTRLDQIRNTSIRQHLGITANYRENAGT